jgi:Uma2 family endonuclease
MAEITTPRPDRSATGTLAPPRRFTVDEYLQMTESGILTEDDAVELIHGQIVEMSPKTPHIASVSRKSIRRSSDS